MTRVLGVDPGSRYLGVGLVESQPSGLRAIHFGVLNARPADPLEFRLKVIFEALETLIVRYRPTAVAVEGVFTHKNSRSALVLGHARGVVLLAAAQASIPVFEYAPARIKKSVGAGGNDSKDAVARMVGLQLGLKVGEERADAYDALAVALCHVSSSRTAGLQRSGSKNAWRDRLKPAFVAPAGIVAT